MPVYQRLPATATKCLNTGCYGYGRSITQAGGVIEDVVIITRN